MSTLYEVNWYIHIEADNPIEAAQVAHSILLDPMNIATIFNVSDEFTVTHVDVNPDGQYNPKVVYETKCGT